ncbi:MAG: hypothetical protein R3258_07310 [Acidimicrobiia bacterium]|nr:hypothetical protein [Acidimicrobiia bacterium]
MDKGTADRGLGETGISSVQFLLASALGLVLFLVFANLVVVQYGRGAIQSALDQGARAGSLAGSTTACEETADDVVAQLLGGAMGDSVQVWCVMSGGVVVASGTAVFDSWTPLAADFAVSLESAAVVESS